MAVFDQTIVAIMLVAYQLSWVDYQAPKVKLQPDLGEFDELLILEFYTIEQ